jgi:hypothetical protein
MRRLAALLVVVAFLVVGALVFTRTGAPSPGPLQPTGNVNSFGVWADDGSTLSLVVEYRGEHEVTATLRSVSLANADSGLTMVGTGILTSNFSGYTLKTFPPGSLKPIDGTVITTRPDDPSGDVFLVLGIKANLRAGPQFARGVWLDYEVGGQTHRALLPWLLTVCRNPVAGVCVGQDGSTFEMPTPGP